MSFAERCFDIFLPLIMAGAVSGAFYLVLTCMIEVGFAKSLRQKFYVLAVMVVCIGFTAICSYYGIKVPLVLLFWGARSREDVMIRRTDYQPKYELIESTKIFSNGKKAYQLRALKDFSDVRTGDLGGYVESESNLSQYGNCWIYKGAQVSDDARVGKNAVICGCPMVCGTAMICGAVRVDSYCKFPPQNKAFWVSEESNAVFVGFYFLDGVTRGEFCFSFSIGACRLNVFDDAWEAFGNMPELICAMQKIGESDGCINIDSFVLMLKSLGYKDITNGYDCLKDAD